MLAQDHLGDGFTGDAHGPVEGHPRAAGDAHVDRGDPGVEVHLRLGGGGRPGPRRGKHQGEYQQGQRQQGLELQRGEA